MNTTYLDIEEIFYIVLILTLSGYYCFKDGGGVESPQFRTGGYSPLGPWTLEYAEQLRLTSLTLDTRENEHRDRVGDGTPLRLAFSSPNVPPHTRDFSLPKTPGLQEVFMRHQREVMRSTNFVSIITNGKSFLKSAHFYSCCSLSVFLQ